MKSLIVLPSPLLLTSVDEVNLNDRHGQGLSQINIRVRQRQRADHLAAQRRCDYCHVGVVVGIADRHAASDEVGVWLGSMLLPSEPRRFMRALPNLGGH